MTMVATQLRDAGLEAPIESGSAWDAALAAYEAAHAATDRYLTDVYEPMKATCAAAYPAYPEIVRWVDDKDGTPKQAASPFGHARHFLHALAAPYERGCPKWLRHRMFVRSSPYANACRRLAVQQDLISRQRRRIDRAHGRAAIEAEYNRLINIEGDAINALVALRAPDIKAVLKKIEIAPDDGFEIIKDDLLSLAGGVA